jgi:hypothetical protein
MRDPVKEYTTVHVVPPTKTTSAVKIIGIEASLDIRFLNSRLGRLADSFGGSEATVIVSAPFF